MEERKIPYTDDELVIRLWDKENIAKVMNRHSYYYGNEMRREELNDLWVCRDENRRTASLAYNNGYYTGLDEVSRNYVVYRESQRYERLKAHSGANPSIQYCNQNLGFGCAAMHTATTPLIYISDDGKTARYLGYDLGFQATGKPDGSADAYFVFGRIFADLIKEDGQWKIWHLVLQHDHTVEAGTSYADVPIYLKPGEDRIEADFGTPTLERTVHNPFFGWEYMWQDMPKPYYAYIEKDGYGPGGDLGKPYYDRERR